MFGNRKRRKREDEDQNYKYTFKKNGDIIQKPTRKDHDFAVIRKNSLIAGAEGADDYKDFTKNRLFGGYKYDLGNNDVLTDFNGTAKTTKSNKKIGTSFTVNDDKIADELYRVVAGNSDVEYLKVGYHNDSDSRTKDYIKTDKLKKEVYFGKHMEDLTNNSTITDITHSHPFNYPGSNNMEPGEKVKINTKFASKDDMNSYNTSLNVIKGRKDLNESYNTEMPKYNTYHPWTYDEDKLPYTMEYNEKGTILPKGMEIGVTLEEYINRLGKTVK